jgi:hypothetical protein
MRIVIMIVLLSDISINVLETDQINNQLSKSMEKVPYLSRLFIYFISET